MIHSSQRPVGLKPEPLVAKEHLKDGKYHLALAASGSVATIKIPSIVERLSCFHNLSIRIVLTQSASNFLQDQSEEQPSLRNIMGMRNVDAIYHDEDEWSVPWTRGCPILHIELRRWAHILVVAPLSANTLAKIANGLCDSLLTSVVRAWQVEPSAPQRTRLDLVTGRAQDPRQKLIVVAPAMNTAMWKHPLTKTQLDLMGPSKPFHWFEVLWPVEKELACGDTGNGAMCDWQEIVAFIENDMVMREQNSREFANG